LWTARLLCDFGPVSPAIASQLTELAAGESNLEVRSQLACSARRLPAEQCLPIVRSLLTHHSDADDPRLPLLLWWAIEAKCDSDRNAVLAFFDDRPMWDFPIVERHLLERLMAGFEAAFAGRSVANLPDNLLAAIDQFAAASPMLGLRQGKAEAVKQALATVLDDKADPTLRLQYVQILGEVHQPSASPALVRLAVESSDSALRSAAMLSLRRYDDPNIAPAILQLFGKLTEDERAAALRLLIARASSARALLDAVERGAIEARQIPADIVLELRWRPEKDLTARLDTLFPDAARVRPSAMKDEIRRLEQVVAARPGIPKDGRELFAEHCAKCHTLFGKGGIAGPELTTYPRQDVHNLLLNIVDPNAAIREGYLTSLVTTADGRALAGVIVDQDQQIVVLRGADGKDLPLARKDIDEIRPATVSIMPQGLLKDFSDEQVRDLFAYLRSSQPVIDR
jgi:putative heme-binding domain-containing protein